MLLDKLLELFGSASWMPHGSCFLWSPGILWTTVVSNLLIALAYFSIPLALLIFVRRRPDVGYRWLLILFAVFIVSCGTSHLVKVATIWWPVYRLSTAVDFVTALSSIGTAITLWPALAVMLQIPSPAQLRQANEALEGQIEERQRAEHLLAQQALVLRQANDQLRQAERLKDQLIANVSHELRTPLTLIMAPLESLLAEGVETVNGGVQNTLKTMYNNAGRLLQLITGLLDFSKLEAEQIQVQREPTGIATQTRRLVEDFEPLFQQKRLEWKLDLPDETVVLLDRYLYERILFNLLSNAIKFTPPGGQVKVVLRYEQSHFTLAVTDTGIGIDAADQPRLFQKFSQIEGNATRRFEGTGLGLALVKQFAALLEGSVSVSSLPGQGSTFTVTGLAPLTHQAPAEAQDSNLVFRSRRLFSTPAAPDSQSSGSGDLPRVLVAEDNTDLAAYVAGLLGSIAQVQIATDGRQALDLVHSWTPDLVLSDVMMPGLDGLELCRRIKADTSTAAIPVVLLTAQTQRQALLKGWEAGADEYLFKPFHPTELVTRIRSILHMRLRLRQMEHSLRRLSRRVIAAQEEERARLAHQLHESTGQMLTALAIQLTLLDPDKAPQQAQLQEINHLVGEIQEEVQSILRRLPPPSLQVSGLDPTLAHLCQQKAYLTGLEISYSGATLPELPRQFSIAFYRLLQEALRNVDRHAHAERVAVSLTATGTQIVLTIEDDGQGFDVDTLFASSEGRGLSLLSLKERFELLQGSVQIDSRPGEGTRIQAFLPLEEEVGVGL